MKTRALAILSVIMIAAHLVTASARDEVALGGGVDGEGDIPAAVAPTAGPVLALAAGRVLTVTGHGVPGLQVVVLAADGAPLDAAVTDAWGFFEVDAESGATLDVIGTPVSGLVIDDPEAPILVLLPGARP